MPKDKTVKERIAVVENEVRNLGEGVKTGFKGVGGQLTALNNKFDNLDKKYATRESLKAMGDGFDGRLKPIEKVVYTIVLAVVLAVLGAGLSFIIK